MPDPGALNVRLSGAAPASSARQQIGEEELRDGKVEEGADAAGAGDADLLDDLRNWARRRPGGFLAGSALAGVVAGRLTRGVRDASSSESTPARVPADSTYPQTYPAGYAGTGAGAGIGDVRGPAGLATGAPTAGVRVASGAGIGAGYVDSPYPSTSYREPLADDGPLYEDPTVAPHRPDVSGI